MLIWYMGGLRMISFYNGQLTDLLPHNLTDNPAVQAYSHALREGTRLLYRYTQLCYVYCSIETMPDNILNLLAAELRTQYYSDSLDIEAKRILVRNTLIWYATAGTPAAVEELVTAVFGEGKVSEWFEYGGKPYFFKIVTEARLTEGADRIFHAMLKRVKNTRSHMEAIEINRNVGQRIYAGTAQAAFYRPAVIIDGYRTERMTEQHIFAGLPQQQEHRPAVIIDSFSDM